MGIKEGDQKLRVDFAKPKKQLHRNWCVNEADKRLN